MARAGKLSAGTSLAAAALIAAGCGSDDSSDNADTTAETTTAETTTTAAPPPPDAPAPPPASGGGSGTGSLSQLTPPSGSKKLASDDQDGTSYSRYSTSDTPQSVIAAYRKELTSDGWSVITAGGSSGGWGPYGGAAEGLTAKKDGDHFDVQAGGKRGGTTFFEVCAGTGQRADCDDMSDQSNTDTDTGGSAAPDDNSDDSKTSPS